MKKMLLVLGLLVCVLMFTRNIMAQEELDLRKLRLLVKKLEAPITFRDERVEKQTIDEFAALSPREVFELRKIHRKIYWPKYARRMNKKEVFVAMEKIDLILFKMIEERFGPEATIYNLPDDWNSWVMDEVANLDVVKQLFVDLENSLNRDKNCKRCSQEESQAKIGILGTTCDYVPDWPRQVPFREGTRWGYLGYKCDRVVNDSPNEWPCDFRIYIESRNYKEVDGGTRPMRCALRKFGVLGASNNLDRFIIGYRIVLCGVPPFEWYIRNTVTFRD